ncbi:flavin-nucleotide-binding protein [Paenibacillus donghaensis]|uniref:pyridoxamine 5'-phosphate oxidase family protein n=1 Tax=Paenibacillus donghaensis TaxID=414771 RepID=UPI001884738D|nr:pyridoxamine 5'-phosphate oxidase family protein [Paenibacillus donghaensis]MBE9915985.1 flavin-nucleotide-binding protein [Paenibacillus donghaensis]
MRRKEFSINEEREIEQFLSGMSFGFLGTVGEDGCPRVTPLNYVYDQGVFYFHGSRVGEKMKHLKANPRVSFSVADEFAVIPSYFTDPHLACPATTYFKSVTASGRAMIVQDLAEKAGVFTLLMKKLQPEGGYDPIDIANPAYAARLRNVAVVKIIPDRMSAKFKFGQNLTDDNREQVLCGLEKRGSERDPETARLIREKCPGAISKE